MTEIKIVISADESALEFSRNLAGLLQNIIPKTVEVASAQIETTTQPTPVKEESASPTSAPSMTMEEVRAIPAEYLKKDRKKLAQVIYQFGVQKVPDLKHKQYVPFVEALRG